MKYQDYYDTTLRAGGVTVDLKDGLPLGRRVKETGVFKECKGFLVWVAPQPWLSVEVYHGDHEPLTQEMFDTALDRIRVQADALGATHVTTIITDTEDSQYIDIDPCRVVATKDYAIGWTDAMGYESIFDLARGEEIFVKRKGNRKNA